MSPNSSSSQANLTKSLDDLLQTGKISRAHSPTAHSVCWQACQLGLHTLHISSQCGQNRDTRCKCTGLLIICHYPNMVSRYRFLMLITAHVNRVLTSIKSTEVERRHVHHAEWRRQSWLHLQSEILNRLPKLCATHLLLSEAKCNNGNFFCDCSV